VHFFALCWLLLILLTIAGVLLLSCTMQQKQPVVDCFTMHGSEIRWSCTLSSCFEQHIGPMWKQQQRQKLCIWFESIHIVAALPIYHRAWYCCVELSWKNQLKRLAFATKPVGFIVFCGARLEIFFVFASRGTPGACFDFWRHETDQRLPSL